MSHVFEASIRGDSGCFIYVSVKKGDRAGRERTPFILLILEKHIISLLLWLYRNKRRPFAVSNDTLFLSVQSKLTRVFLVIFAVIKKIGDSPHRCRLRPQGKPIRDRVGRVHSYHITNRGKNRCRWRDTDDSQIWRRPPPPPLLKYFFYRSTRFTWMTYFKVKTANFAERWQVCTPDTMYLLL